MPDSHMTPDGGLLRGFLSVQDGGEGPHAYVVSTPVDAQRAEGWRTGEHLSAWLAQFADGAEVSIIVQNTYREDTHA